MANTADLFRIIPYAPEYAASLADMWNHSVENWGGSNTIRTEQSILEAHACSINIAEFLAVDATGSVIGFCSFSRYFRDTGAMYIPLLNVRPDWHGKKVGKALVLAAVHETVAMGWPRLDLFTWPGNTKAVPTYKKCGFFWEKRDDTTHLMNFIPTVLQTGLLKPFFEMADWYDDAVREINIEPDGRETNGFEFFTYVWNHEGHQARAEFEKSGRGLRLVETDDFLIAMELDAHKVVAGRSLPVNIRCVNKSGMPMHVRITGIADGPVTCQIDRIAVVADACMLSGQYTAELLPEPQNLMKTHPCVTVGIEVNGLSAHMRMGVEIRPPALFKVQAPSVPCFAGEHRMGWLDVENCLDDAALISISLPESEVLQPDVRQWQLSLKPLEKRSFAFPHTILRNGWWDVSASATASLSSGETLPFNAPLRCLVKGWHGRYAGENDTDWFMVCGRFSYHLSKDGGSGVVRTFGHDESVTLFRCPSPGLPYSNEFSTIRAERVEARQEDDGSMLQLADFMSSDFPGVMVRAAVRLWPHGELHRTLSVHNTTGAPLPFKLHVSDTIWHDLTEGVIPYDGRFIQLADENETNLDLYEISRFSENWMFARGEQFTRGLFWQPGVKAVLSHGLALQHVPGYLPARGVWQAPPVILACGMFEDWQAFRSFARGCHLPDQAQVQQALDIAVNGGNPIVWPARQSDIGKSGKDAQIPVLITNYMMAAYHARITATWNKPESVPVCVQDMDLGADPVQLSVPPPDKASAVLMASLDCADQSITYRKHLIFPSGQPIRQYERVRQSCRVLHADNGRLSIAASPDFSHALLSLQVDGQEWLDSSFPNPAPRSWWGSWPGGISAKPWGLQHRSLHDAGRTCAFAAVSDQFGNQWTGLVSTTVICDPPRFKGLTLSNYWVMLPGVPVLAHFVKIQNNTGAVLLDVQFGCEAFFRPDSDLQRCWFESEDHHGQIRRYRGGFTRHDIFASDRILFGSEGQQTLLQLLVSSRHGPQMPLANNQIIAWMKTLSITAPDGSDGWSDPVFFIAVDRPLPTADLADLARLSFSQTQTDGDK